MLLVRSAGPADLPAIAAIYDDAVLKTTATFDTEPRPPEVHRRWFEAHADPRHPILVAEEDGVVVGWASLSAWSDRCAYAETAELSVYVAEASRGKGVGKRLMKEVIEAGRAAGLRTLLSRIADENAASVKLHESFGFARCGVMRQVGRKFGRLLDVSMFQLMYE